MFLHTYQVQPTIIEQNDQSSWSRDALKKRRAASCFRSGCRDAPNGRGRVRSSAFVSRVEGLEESILVHEGVEVEDDVGGVAVGQQTHPRSGVAVHRLEAIVKVKHLNGGHQEGRDQSPVFQSDASRGIDGKDDIR